jgi:hypothetical protein
MRYLKSYKIFEDSDESINSGEDLIDYFYDLTDENVEYEFEQLKNKHFLIKLSNVQENKEDLIKSIVSRINTSKSIKLRYSKVENNYYIFDLDLINKFKYLIEDLEMIKDNGNIIFKNSDNEILMKQNLKKRYLYVSYLRIWSKFESYFPDPSPDPNFEDQRGFMSNLVEEVFKFRPSTPGPAATGLLCR